MRNVVLAIVVLFNCCSAPSVSAADPKLSMALDAQGNPLVTDAAQSAVDEGLALLAARQRSDGSLGSGRYRNNAAVAGLTGLAFISSGSTPGRGPYGKNVDRITKYLLSICQSNGFIHHPEDRAHGPMYGHGFATLFLAEVYGMSKQKELRPKLEKAVQLIVHAQNSDGGWRYGPRPNDADVSVTVCQIMALRAARNSGVHVPKAVVDRCIAYLKKCQNADGGFRYQNRPMESKFHRSAAGVVALYSAGIYEGPELESALGYVMRYHPGRLHLQQDSFYYYGHYYAVQAMWQRGGEDWKSWYPAIRDQLLRSEYRHSTGGWSANHVCVEYSTAMACLILQTPNNYLPIFER